MIKGRPSFGTGARVPRVSPEGGGRIEAGGFVGPSAFSSRFLAEFKTTAPRISDSIRPEGSPPIGGTRVTGLERRIPFRTITTSERPSTSGGKDRLEGLRVIPPPQRNRSERPYSGREFIKSLGEFKTTAISPVNEDLASAENIRNSVVFSTTLPNKDRSIHTRHAIPPKRREFSTKLETRTINDLAVLARRASERELRAVLSTGSVESVKALPDVVAKSQLEPKKVAIKPVGVFRSIAITTPQKAQISEQEQIQVIQKSLQQDLAVNTEVTLGILTNIDQQNATDTEISVQPLTMIASDKKLQKVTDTQTQSQLEMMTGTSTPTSTDEVNKVDLVLDKNARKNRRDALTEGVIKAKRTREGKVTGPDVVAASDKKHTMPLTSEAVLQEGFSHDGGEFILFNLASEQRAFTPGEMLKRLFDLEEEIRPVARGMNGLRVNLKDLQLARSNVNPKELEKGTRSLA